MNTMNYSAVIVAAGKGERSGLDYNKVLRPIHGKRVLRHALDAFIQDPECTSITVVVSKADYRVIQAELAALVDHVVIGGKSRRESVGEGLKTVDTPYVFIHDAARPFVSKEVLSKLKETLRYYDAVSPALPVPDTLKKIENGMIVGDLERKDVVGLQTPQAFTTYVIKEAHNLAKKENIDAPCDLTLASQVGGVKGTVVDGDPRAMKYTHARDLRLLELILNDANRTQS
ncbi:MAG: 2-C-methyl-D-erythritol 4-phosphate cytidylyltransferase [Bacillota bacterium]